MPRAGSKSSSGFHSLGSTLPTVCFTTAAKVPVSACCACAGDTPGRRRAIMRRHHHFGEPYRVSNPAGCPQALNSSRFCSGIQKSVEMAGSIPLKPRAVIPTTVDRNSLDVNGLAHDRRIAREASRPVVVTENSDGRVAGLIVERESAPAFHAHAQSRKEVSADLFSLGRLGKFSMPHRDASIEAQRHVADQVLENVSALAQRFEYRFRERSRPNRPCCRPPGGCPSPLAMRT